jgi:hypothetical protein
MKLQKWLDGSDGIGAEISENTRVKFGLGALATGYK